MPLSHDKKNLVLFPTESGYQKSAVESCVMNRVDGSKLYLFLKDTRTYSKWNCSLFCWQMRWGKASTWEQVYLLKRTRRVQGWIWFWRQFGNVELKYVTWRPSQMDCPRFWKVVSSLFFEISNQDKSTGGHWIKTVIALSHTSALEIWQGSCH